MTSSGYIKELKAKEKSPEEISIKKTQVSKLIQSLTDEKLPPLEYIQNVGCSDLTHFKNSSLNQFNELVSRFRVGDDWKLLDMGCGCGRLAFPFSEYLGEKGEYVGFDVWLDGVQWCKENFKKNFKFRHVHAEDNYYYQDSRSKKENNFSLNFVGVNSVDLVFAISLFTHLTKEDAKTYFREISLVLKPGRFAYLTCFIIDKYFFEYQTGTHRFSELIEEESGCYYGYQRQDFFAGFSLENLSTWISDAGLELVFHELGSWAEKPGARGFHDLLLIRKT